MGKSVAKNRAREAKEKLEKRSALISTALDENFTTKTSLSNATGFAIWEINDVFRDNRELYNKFCIRRRTLVDTAADNVEDILKDPLHAQHFQASKFILQTYKSDLDENLEAKNAEEISVDVRTESKGIPIQIVFSKRSAAKEEEEE